MALWQNEEWLENQAGISNYELAKNYGGSESVYRKWRKRYGLSDSINKVDKKKKEPKSKRKDGDIERIVCLSDVHVPYHDEEAFHCALDYIKQTKPDEVIIGGDFLDMYSISKFAKIVTPANSLLQEIAIAKQMLKELRKTVGDGTRITYIQGNHEFRMQTYLCNNAPELIGFDALSVPALLDLESLDIEYIESQTRTSYVIRSGVAIGHFNKVSKFSAYTAKALVEQNFSSVVQFHTHRLGEHYRTTPFSVYKGVEGGCLCQLEPEYVDNPDWQHGIVVMERVVGGDRYNIVGVPIIEGKMLFNGKIYGGAKNENAK